MNLFSFICFLFCLNIVAVLSQDCAIPTDGGEIFIRNSTAHSISEQKCTRLVGNVTFSREILQEQLMKLENITHVTGSLTITTAVHLTSLNGLNSLTSVGGSFQITSNQALTSLRGLESLTSVGSGTNKAEDPLVISANNNLESLDGLQGIVTLRTGLHLSYLPALTNFSGLSNLQTISKEMIFRHLSNSDFSGFMSLKFVHRDMIVEYCENDSFEGFPVLETIGGFIAQFNNKLTSFDGFENVLIIDQDFTVQNNSALDCDNCTVREEIAHIRKNQDTPWLGGQCNVTKDEVCTTVPTSSTVETTKAMNSSMSESVSTSETSSKATSKTASTQQANTDTKTANNCRVLESSLAVVFALCVFLM